jgi:hypothetical protein
VVLGLLVPIAAPLTMFNLHQRRYGMVGYRIGAYCRGLRSAQRLDCLMWNAVMMGMFIVIPAGPALAIEQR